GYRLDFHVAQAEGIAAHDAGIAIVGATLRILVALAVGAQLGSNIFRVLSGEARIAGGRIALSGRRVTGGAGSDLAISHPGAIDLLTQLYQRRIRLAAGYALRGIVGGDVRQLLVTLAVKLAGH